MHDTDTTESQRVTAGELRAMCMKEKIAEAMLLDETRRDVGNGFPLSEAGEHTRARFLRQADAILPLIPTPEGVARALRNNGYLVPVKMLAAAIQRGDA